VPDEFKRSELLYEPKNVMVTVMFPDKGESYRCVKYSKKYPSVDFSAISNAPLRFPKFDLASHVLSNFPSKSNISFGACVKAADDYQKLIVSSFPKIPIPPTAVPQSTPSSTFFKNVDALNKVDERKRKAQMDRQKKAKMNRVGGDLSELLRVGKSTGGMQLLSSSDSE
jgi:hypothetical protein